MPAGALAPSATIANTAVAAPISHGSLALVSYSSPEITLAAAHEPTIPSTTPTAVRFSACPTIRAVMSLRFAPKCHANAYLKRSPNDLLCQQSINPQRGKHAEPCLQILPAARFGSVAVRSARTGWSASLFMFEIIASRSTLVAACCTCSEMPIGFGRRAHHQRGCLSRRLRHWPVHYRRRDVAHLTKHVRGFYVAHHAHNCQPRRRMIFRASQLDLPSQHVTRREILLWPTRALIRATAVCPCDRWPRNFVLPAAGPPPCEDTPRSRPDSPRYALPNAHRMSCLATASTSEPSGSTLDARDALRTPGERRKPLQHCLCLPLLHIRIRPRLRRQIQLCRQQMVRTISQRFGRQPCEARPE